MGKGVEYDGERDMEQFWAVARPPREPAGSRAYLVGLVLLVLLCTPFYWDGSADPALAWGLPVWVWIAIGCAAAVSCLTAWTALTRWDDQEPEAPPEAPP